LIRSPGYRRGASRFARKEGSRRGKAAPSLSSLAFDSIEST
jgi:hypothetical protein